MLPLRALFVSLLIAQRFGDNDEAHVNPLRELATFPAVIALAVALVTGRPFDGTAAVDAQWPALGRVLRRMTEPVPSDRFESLEGAASVGAVDHLPAGCAGGPSAEAGSVKLRFG